MTGSGSAGSHHNGFTVIRLLAATLVLITHTYVVLGIQGGDILERHGVIGFSKFGVDAFFVVSGYLVAASLMRNGNLLAFVANRALRIIPGLSVSVILTVFVVGAALTSESEYLAHSATYAYLRNILLFDLQPLLPGVFEKNATSVINGSLWTLPIEVLCYVMLAMIGWAGAAKLRVFFLISALMLCLHLNDTFLQGGKFLTVGKLSLNEFGYLFMAGSFLAAARGKILLNKFVTIAAIVAVIGGFAFGGDDWHNEAAIYLLLWPYIVISSALLLKRFAWLNKHDISYGVYIYGFVIQQALAHSFPQLRDPISFTLISIAISYAIGYASWALVEKPCLNLKSKIRFGYFQGPSVQAA